MLPSSSCADGGFVEVAALAVDDVDRGHDHAGRAEAALQAVVLAEGLLHGMQLAVLGQALDGRDLGAVAGGGQHGAGLHGAAVHVHHAGAALAGVAAHMRAGEALVLAEELHQQGARIDLGADGLAVDRH